MTGDVCLGDDVGHGRTMIRTIIDFSVDSDGDWVADLSCYHRQHIRNQPPFQDRAWVLDADGRAGHVGTPIECPLCDRAELPEDLTILGKAGPWNQDSLPAGLLGAHRTPQGRWGRLRIDNGTVDFQFESDSLDDSIAHLRAGSHQSIPPDVPHRLILTGPLRLELEFWGRQT